MIFIKREKKKLIFVAVFAGRTQWREGEQARPSRERERETTVSREESERVRQRATY